MRPVGWLEEFRKLEDMKSASNSIHLIEAESWQVKMRMINRDTVLPRQVSQHSECFENILFRVCSSLATELYVGPSLTCMSLSKF